MKQKKTKRKKNQKLL